MKCNALVGVIAPMMLILSRGEAAKKGISSLRLTGGDDENCFARDEDREEGTELEGRSGAV